MSTQPSIQIPADAMRDIVAKAVLEQITPEQRDLLIQAALQYLVTPPPKTGGYGAPAPTSPLQDAFDIAVRGAASQVVQEMVKGELAERIRGLIREKVTEALATNSSLAWGIGQAVGDAVEKSLRGDQ